MPFGAMRMILPARLAWASNAALVHETSNERRQLILAHRSHHDCVVRMAKCGRVEAPVASEEGRLAQTTQQHYDLFILESFSAHIEADLASGYFPSFQEQALPVQDVFIEDDHERSGCSTYSVATYWPA